MALLGFIQSQPTLAVFLSGQGKSLIHYTSLEFLDAFFAFHRDSPISYHLWFLRDLMFMVLFSPCFWVLAKRATSTAFVSLALLWLMGGEIGFLNLRSEGLFFFYCGILLALHKDHLLWPDRYGKFFIGLYFPLAVLSAALTASSPSNFLFFSHPVQQGIKAIGIVAFWCLAGRAKEGKIGVLMKGLSGFSFFVYASHEPVLTITKKLLYWWNPPAGSLQALSYYFLAPLVVVILTLHLGLILEKYAPTFFGILNGQRFSRKVRAGRCFDGGSKNWFRRDEKVDSFGQSEKAI